MNNLKQRLAALYRQYGDVLRYLVIGGLTTVIDLVVFAVANGLLGVHYQAAKVIAWVLAVAFAFWGNKFVVFRTQSKDRQGVLREAGSFVAMRLLTLGFSALFLYVTIGRWQWDENLSNLVCNVVVVVLNYVLSKLVVFRGKRGE